MYVSPPLCSILHYATLYGTTPAGYAPPDCTKKNVILNREQAFAKNVLYSHKSALLSVTNFYDNS